MNQKIILFVDNTYPEPYQVSTLVEKSIGGTESSIIRTAQILSTEYKVYVAQKYRFEQCVENDNLKFIPKTDIKSITPNYVIVLRKYKVLKEMHKLYPQSTMFLWLHTYKNYEYVLKRPGLSHSNSQIICNSETHKIHTNKLLNLTIVAKLFSIFTKKIKVNYCYNPIEKPADFVVRKDLNKLLFFSSPNKGLDQVIKKFKIINQQLTELKLYIANPGYKNSDTEELDENIIYLGSLAKDEMMQHVRESLCIFYPQEIFAETFGLIYAEANANGTAVIADDIGSAKEILQNNNQPFDVSNINKVIDYIVNLQNEYPKIQYNEKFSSQNIFKQWQAILL